MIADVFPAFLKKENAAKIYQCNRSCLIQVLMASTKQEPPAECDGSHQDPPSYWAKLRSLTNITQSRGL